MILLFGRLYELRAEKAAEGGAKVVVVGPPCAGKTTFIKQFLEPRGVEAAEEVVGLAPVAEETREEGLLQRLRMRVLGRYVRGDEVKRVLGGISDAGPLKAFDKLPRDFVEYLKERYVGWSLYLFYIPPDAEYEEARGLRAVMEEVGVEFRWFGLSYLPPGLAKALAEKGEDYVRQQLKLYKELAEELDIAEGRLRKAAESALESLLGQVKEVAERLIDAAAPGGGVAASILTEVLTALLFSRGGWGELIKLVAGLGELDEALRCILAARLALALGSDRGAVEKALATLAGASTEELAEEVKALKNAADRLWVEVKSAKRGVDVLFLEDVELGGLYENFVVLNEKPYVDLQEGLFPLVAGGRFEEEARRVLEKLKRDGVAVLVGPKGIGKSTLAAYVVWKMLSSGEAEAAVRVEKSANELALKRTLDFVKRGVVVLYDPSPLEVYYKHKYMEKTNRPEEVIETLEELADFLRSGGGDVRLLVVLPTDLYEVVKDKMPEAFKNAVLEIKLHDLQFLHSVIKTYSSCEGDYSKLAEKIARLDGGYTLVAKYAGLWLRGRVCDAGDVEKAVEEVKKEPKLFLARYIRDVLLWRSSEEERVRLLYRVAAPLLLHAVFGPVPEGVTYITQAKDGAVFYQPEEIEKFTKPQWDLLKAGLQPIAKWLAQRHEDLIEEALRDLAGLNGEEARKQYEETLGDLIKALNWACDEVLNESCEILAKLGIPERNRRMKSSLSAFVAKRLTAVFKSGGGRNCWQRVALIVGHALAGYPKLPKRKRLAKDVVEALGDALKPCAVDAYLTIDDKIPPLSIGVARLMHKRELNILSPLAETKTIDDVRKTAEGLLAKWRRSGINLHEAFYALGLAALAAGGKVNKKTADRLLYAASFAVQEVAHPAAVLPVLAALRPLGKKAPHRYVSLLAAASELRTLGQKTVEYIYVALQKLKNLLTETGHLWPLVEAVRTYSNLMRRRQWHIGGLLKEAVADMCKLYSKVKGRDDTTASGNGLLAQRPSYTTAKVYVLAVALGSDVLVPLVQWHCGLGDLEKEAEAVRSVLDWAADHPEELKKIMENDKDFAEWVRVRDVTEDAKRVIEDLRVRLTYVLARYKLNHAPDAEKLEEVAKEFEKAAEMRIKLEQWGGYLIARSLTLRARVFAAKSWGELLERAEGFWELWEEAKKQLKPTARYLATAALPLGEYLVYLAASGDKRGAEELLKKWLWLLDYDPRASVNARLMLRVLGVGEGARLNEVVDVFESSIWREYRPALLMLAGRLQKDEASNRCKKLPKPEVCVNAVAAATGDQDAIKGLKSEIEWEVPEASLLLDRVDGRTLAEVLAPKYPSAQLAFTLLATVEGRADAVRLHGLWGSAISREPLPRQLSRAVYENCGDLNREECRVALLKLYYYHV
jgi:energy-coupling factor transporter ATP-binding protein EcfA2